MGRFIGARGETAGRGRDDSRFGSRAFTDGGADARLPDAASEAGGRDAREVDVAGMAGIVRRAPGRRGGRLRVDVATAAGASSASNSSQSIWTSIVMVRGGGGTLTFTAASSDSSQFIWTSIV